MEFHDQRWKRELTQHANAIAIIALHDESTYDDFFEGERPIFYAAFIIRKLIEDTAVTDSLKSRSLELLTSPSKSSEARLFMAGAMGGPIQIEDHFDFSQRKKIRISYEDLASEIIHSDGFAWDISVPPPHAFFVFSYRNRLKRLLFVPVDAYLRVLGEVLKDDPTHWWTSKDLVTGKVTKHASHKRRKGEVVQAVAANPAHAELFDKLFGKKKRGDA
jgi:hypothetical protein